MSIFYRGKTVRNKNATDIDPSQAYDDYVAGLFNQLDTASPRAGKREAVSAVCEALSSFMKIESEALSSAPQQAESEPAPSGLRGNEGAQA
jgi:hypothetical protein